FAEHAARTTCDGTAVAQAGGRRVARQRLQLGARLGALFFGDALILGHRDQRSPLGGELGDSLAALQLAVNDGSLGHIRNPLTLKRRLEGGEQRAGFLVRLRSRGDADVHAAQRINLVVLDFGKNDLLPHAEVVVAPTIEGTRRYSAE